MYIVIIKFNRLNYFGKKRANWIFYVASSCLVIDHNGLPRNSWFPRNSFTVSFEEHCRRCKIRCKRRGRWGEGGRKVSFYSRGSSICVGESRVASYIDSRNRTLKLIRFANWYFDTMGRVAEERNWHDRAIGIDEEEGNEGYSRLFDRRKKSTNRREEREKE